jgi:hypothetical protein
MVAGRGAVQGEGTLSLATVVAAVAEEGDVDVGHGLADAAEPAEELGIASEDETDLSASATDLVRRSPIETQILSRLKHRTPPLEFLNWPLKDVTAVIAEEIGGEVWIDEVALDAVAIDSNIEVSGSFKKVPLQSALRIMLGSVNLTYVVKDNVLVITTLEDAESMLEPHVYNLESIVTSPVDLKELAEVIPQTIRPETWLAAGRGEGTIATLGKNLLVINQTVSVHEEIDKFFEQLSRGGVQVGGSTNAGK